MTKKNNTEKPIQKIKKIGNISPTKSTQISKSYSTGDTDRVQYFKLTLKRVDISRKFRKKEKHY